MLISERPAMMPHMPPKLLNISNQYEATSCLYIHVSGWPKKIRTTATSETSSMPRLKPESSEIRMTLSCGFGWVDRFFPYVKLNPVRRVGMSGSSEVEMWYLVLVHEGKHSGQYSDSSISFSRPGMSTMLVITVDHLTGGTNK